MGDETRFGRVLRAGWGFGVPRISSRKMDSGGGLVEIGFGVGEIEQLHGPADRYKADSALFLQVALFAGKNVFDHAHQEHHRKFKSFAAVDSHQANTLPVIAHSFILKGFGVFDERLNVVKAGCCHDQLVEIFDFHVIGTGKIAVCHETIIIEGTPEQLDQFRRLKGFGIGNERVDQLNELPDVFPDVGQLDGHGLQLIVKVQTRPRLKLIQLGHELSARCSGWAR